MTKCPNCQGTVDLIHDTTGQRICQGCGNVLDENAIVSEVTFQENANGSTSVIGQFVPSSGPSKLSGVNARHGPAGHNRESREITMQNAKRRLGQLTAALRLAQQNQDQALRIYQLAVQSNFVQGRKSQHVVAACLYVVCRREVKPHMLIDFAEVLQTNVFALGATVMQLLRALKLSIPLVDPSLYIVRFAHNLELGEYTHAVSQTALKIIAHMERDWMVTGRRPSGLCGAALIIAARMYNFKRSLKEIARVVRIGDFTLRRRLDEFQNSNAMDLSVEELDRLDVEAIKKDPIQLDPPAFIRSQIADNVKRKLTELITTVPDLSHLVKDPTALSAPRLEGHMKTDSKLGLLEKEAKELPEGVELTILPPKYSLAENDEMSLPSATSLSQALDDPSMKVAAEATLEKTAMHSLESVNDILRQIRSVFSNNAELNDIYSALNAAFEEGGATELEDPEDGEEDEDEDVDEEAVFNRVVRGTNRSIKSEDEQRSKSRLKFINAISKQDPGALTAPVLEGERHMNGLRAVLGAEIIDESVLELVEAALSQRIVPLSKLVEMRGERTASDIVEKDKEAERARQILRVRADMEAWSAEREIDTLSDVEDDEVRSVILTQEESKAKSESWCAVYQDYIDAMERKRRLEEEQQRMGIRPARKSKSRRGALDVGLPLSRIEKRISDRIDYRALDLISNADPAVANALSRSIPHTPGFRAAGSATPQLRTPLVGAVKSLSETSVLNTIRAPSQTSVSASISNGNSVKMEEFSLGTGAKMQPSKLSSRASNGKMKSELSVDLPSSIATPAASVPIPLPIKGSQPKTAPVPQPVVEEDAMLLPTSATLTQRTESASKPHVADDDAISLTPTPSLIGLTQPTTSAATTATTITTATTSTPATTTSTPATRTDEDEGEDDTFGLGRKKTKTPLGPPVAPKRPRR